MSRGRGRTKAELQRLAIELRAEVGLDAYARLNPLVLTAEYGIPVVTTAELSLDRAVDEVLAGPGGLVLSAATVWDGPRAIIVVNASHDSGRNNNSISHEFGHIVMEHPTEPLQVGHVARTWSRRAEQDADEFAGALLLPEPAASRHIYERTSFEDVADLYGVSVELARWRMNMSSGAAKLRRRRAG